LEYMAGTTGLEPATSAVTGQRSNQLSYVPGFFPAFFQTGSGSVVFVRMTMLTVPAGC
jgi:hypothetical protein